MYLFFIISWMRKKRCELLVAKSQWQRWPNTLFWFFYGKNLWPILGKKKNTLYLLHFLTFGWHLLGITYSTMEDANMGKCQVEAWGMLEQGSDMQAQQPYIISGQWTHKLWQLLQKGATFPSRNAYSNKPVNISIIPSKISMFNIS